MSATRLNESLKLEATSHSTCNRVSVLPSVEIAGNSRQLCPEGWLSLCCYMGTIVIVLVPSILQQYLGIIPQQWGALFWGPLVYYALVHLTIRYIFQQNDYQIALRATFLGFATTCGMLMILLIPGVWKQFGAYCIFMSFFHYSEYLTIAWCNPASLSLDSFILNHSWAYGIAAFSCWLEFFLEVYFLPAFKHWYYLWLSGVVLCTFGEAIRKIAMITASKSFTHMVQHEKNDSQVLVTHGIYAYVRHPAYVGWFWWSIGTQIILMNPACLVIYTVVSWKFFYDRIYCEEYSLLNFFQRDYQAYQKKVPTGLPFIRGFYCK